MKLVVNINELDYETIKEVDELSGEWKTDIASQTMKAIANGTLLSEVIEGIKAEIEKQIERDFAFAENENVKVPCHYGTANGLQVALRIIDGVIDKHIGGEESK